MIRIKKNNPLLIFAVVLGLLVFLHGLGIIRPLEDALLFLVKPVSGKLYAWGTGINSSYNENREKADLLAEINRLQQEATELTIQDSHWREVADENQKLRNQLNFIAANKFKVVLANIIAQEDSFSATEDSRDLVIDKGRKDGLRPDYGVLSPDGAIIGKVVEVNDTSSRICLVTSPGCQLAASLQNEDKTKGITNGNLGLTIDMNYIPQLEKINIGDTVVTSGLGGNIPRGLVIGKVSELKSESNEVWQAATIEPLVNLNDLTVVSIVTP